MTEKNTEKQTKDLEGSMRRLDEVLEALSGEGVKLEDALALYEEGVSLVRECNSMLEDAERKISILRTGDSGEITSEQYPQ